MAKIKKMFDVSSDGSERKLFYPATITQAIHDGRTGASLESILARHNSFYLQYQGTSANTRCLLPSELRRTGTIITYKTPDGIVSERSMNDYKSDDLWGNDVNWNRIDELSLSGKLSVSANGTWVIEGEDTGISAVGPKGENGLTPLLKTIDNKLHYSYDGNIWNDAGGEYISAWFRWSGNKIQISRDNKIWEDFSGEFADNLFIKGYVATYAELPTTAVQGDIWGVGPRYAAEDTEQTQPIYRYWVRNAGGWVDNGEFTSIAAGIVQETGDGEGVVMSQKAVTEKIGELASEVPHIWGSDVCILQGYIWSNDGYLVKATNANPEYFFASPKLPLSLFDKPFQLGLNKISGGWVAQEDKLGVAFFDKEKLFISGLTQGVIKGSDIPSNAKYIAFTSYTNLSEEAREPLVFYNAGVDKRIEGISSYIEDKCFSANYPLVKEMFIPGYYSNSTGSASSVTNDGISIKTIRKIRVRKGTTYSIDNHGGYLVAIFHYNADGSYISGNWFGNRTSFTALGEYVNICLRNENGLTVDTYDDYVTLYNTDADKANSAITAITSPYLTPVKEITNFEYKQNKLFIKVDSNGFVYDTTSANRYSVGPFYLSNGKIKVTVDFANGFRYAVARGTDTKVSDSGWQTEAKEWDITQYNFTIAISRTDNKKFVPEDAQLQIEALSDLYPSLATQKQVHSLKERIDKIESIDSIGKEVYPINSPYNYGHLFIDKIYNDSIVTVPCQSKFDVFVTHKCGMRMIEANVLLTSDDVPICGHQNGTNILTTLTDLEGNSVSVNVRETTFADLRANYRYNSIYPQYRTPITSLEEFLLECSKYNMTPFVTYVNEDVEALIQSIVGQRYVSYDGRRANVKTTISSYEGGTIDELVAICESMGAPYMLCVKLSALRAFTDDELKELVKRVHEVGCWIGWAGCYHTPLENEKYKSLGFDFNASGWDVEDFEHGDILHKTYNSVTGWDELKVDSGTLNTSNGYAILPNDTGISIGFNEPKGIITKGSLHIHYKGSLSINMGSHIHHVFAKDNEELVLTTIYENENSRCYLWAEGDVEIYSISFKVASVI